MVTTTLRLIHSQGLGASIFHLKDLARGNSEDQADFPQPAGTLDLSD